tara:strand:+ start:1422 stop:2027 length:606 start_codon:yes stop_codon:yes gene_type:complete
MFGGGKYGGSLSKLGGSRGSGSSWKWNDLFDFDSIIPDPIPEATTRDAEGNLRRKTYKELEAEGFTSDTPRHGPGSYGASSGYEDDPLKEYDPEEPWWKKIDKKKLGEALEGLAEQEPAQKGKLSSLPDVPVKLGSVKGGKQVGAGLVSSQDKYERDSVLTAHMLRQMAHDQWMKQLIGAEVMSAFSLLGQEPLSTQRLFA